VAEKHKISIDAPRTSLSVIDFYRIGLTTDFLDRLNESIELRFSIKHLALYSGFNLLPPVISNDHRWRNKLRAFLDQYSDFLNLDYIDAELDLWETFWEKESPYFEAHRLLYVGKLLLLFEKYAIKTTFPNIYQCLKIIGTIPVTTCECERSISVIRRLKDYKRTTMKQDRFNNLALIYVHREYIHNLDNILDTFAIRKHRRMEFKDILDDVEDK